MPVECGGRDATAQMLRLAFSAPTDSDGDGLLDREGGDGRRVVLRTDPTQDLFDRYDRLLAYVTTRGGTSLQKWMLDWVGHRLRLRVQGLPARGELSRRRDRGCRGARPLLR